MLGPVLTLEITSSVLTVDVGPCCSTKPPDPGHRARPSSSQAADPPTPPRSDRPLPVVVLVIITISAGILLCLGVFLFFAHRRRAKKRRQAAKMRHDAKTYHSVAARPETPPTAPSSPSSSSSLSTPSLLDLGFMREDTDLSRSQQPRTPDRRSVDTAAALRSYGHERGPHKHSGLGGNQQADIPFIAELPAMPPLQQTSAPPPTPPPTTPPRKGPAVPMRKEVGGAKPITYLNPVGEPWVNVPPPSVPLPAPPVQRKTTTPSTGPKRSAQHNPRSDPQLQPVFSLFPQPPKVSATARPPSQQQQQQQHTLSSSSGQWQGQAQREHQPASPPPRPPASPLPLSPPQDQQKQAKHHSGGQDQERQRGRQRNFSRPTLTTVLVPDSAPNAGPTSDFRSGDGGSGGGSSGSSRGRNSEALKTREAVPPPLPPPPPGEHTPARDAGRKPRSGRSWYGPDLGPESGSRRSGGRWRSPALQQAVFW